MNYEIGQIVYFKAPWHESKEQWEPLTIAAVHEHYISARNSLGHVNRYTFDVIEPSK